MSRYLRQFAAIWVIFGSIVGAKSASGLEWLYVSMNDDTIRRYDISQTSAALVAASMQTFVGNGQGLSTPYGLAFDSSGNLYAANVGNSTITRYSPTGAYSGSPFVGSSGTGLFLPFDLTFDSSGNLYVGNIDANSDSTILRYDSSGNYIGNAPFVTGSSLSVPDGLAFDASGKLYVSNAGNNTITRYDSAGNYIDNAPFVGSTGTGLNSPKGLAFDSSGKLYVANSDNNTITRYDSSGTYIGGTPFVPAGQGVEQPIGLAFDSSGNLYVANMATSGGGYISKINSAGTVLFSWSTPADPSYLALVPEPSTYILGAIGTLTMAWLARRRKARVNG